MANENVQEQLVDPQTTQGSAQESMETQVEALDSALGTMTDPDRNASRDVQAAMDRLQLLETQHRELTSLVQYVWQSSRRLLHN